MTTKNIQIITNLDLSTITGSLNIPIVGDFSKYDYISVQHEWESLAGTLNSTIDFQQKNSALAESYATVEDLRITMSAAEDSSIQEHVAFAGSHINILITKNNVTGGLLNSYLVAKVK